jgi:hypothetical protein
MVSIIFFDSFSAGGGVSAEIETLKMAAKQLCIMA